jgi:hypothetical protein
MAAESLLARALSTLVTDFNRRGIQYALAGGWAYSALVEPRATTDIDILLLLEQPSRDRLHSLHLLPHIFSWMAACQPTLPNGNR